MMGQNTKTKVPRIAFTSTPSIFIMSFPASNQRVFLKLVRAVSMPKVPRIACISTSVLNLRIIIMNVLAIRVPPIIPRKR